MVVWSQPQNGWMLPMSTKYNDTKLEQETQQWCPGMGAVYGGPRFQNLSKNAKKKSFFLAHFEFCLWRGPFALEPT